MNPINNTDNELQRAIDDITKSAGRDKNAGSSSAQELEAKIQNNMGTPPVPENSGLPPMPGARPVAPGRFEEMPMPAPGARVSMADVRPGGAPATTIEVAGVEAEGGDLGSVREAMMRDLFPLMDKVEMSAEQKYELYHEMIEMTHDMGMVPAAYDTVREIGDERMRAEALLYLLSVTNR